MTLIVLASVVAVVLLARYIRIGRRLPPTEFEQRKAFFAPPLSPEQRQQDLILDGHGRR